MEITTVEGIGQVGNLHPVQQRLADNNGSQCGFCTSGMVATMYGLLQTNANPTQSQVIEALDGNLCRCTGYRPIVSAFEVKFCTHFIFFFLFFWKQKDLWDGSRSCSCTHKWRLLLQRSVRVSRH
jgi:hypothetical protein